MLCNQVMRMSAVDVMAFCGIIIGIICIGSAAFFGVVAPVFYTHGVIETQIEYTSIGQSLFGAYPILMTSDGNYDVSLHRFSQDAAFEFARTMPRNTTLILNLEDNKVISWDIKK